jgi:hypothetical protein
MVRDASQSQKIEETQNMNTEVATLDDSEENALATVQEMDLAADLFDAAEETPDIGKEDMQIPFLRILQALSPQVDQDRGEYIDGARSGLIFNTSTNEIMEDVLVLPIAYSRRHLEWRPREAGGGLVMDHGPDESILDRCTFVKDTGQHFTPDGNEIIVNGTWYVFILDAEGNYQGEAIIAMSKSQLRASRQWQSLRVSERIPDPRNPAVTKVAPYFYRSYKLSTLRRSNDNGSWYVWKVERDRLIVELPKPKTLIAQAKDLSASITSGDVKLAADTGAEDTGGATATTRTSGGKDDLDDDIPF